MDKTTKFLVSDIDGHAITITAKRFTIDGLGTLLFEDDNGISAAFAHGTWTYVTKSQ